MERDPYIGRMLGDRYQLESLVGRGGFGAVYRARHVALDRTVAVKLNLHLHKRELTARFEREARVMARLRHPRCVTLLDYGNEDGLTYMVQEFVDGTTLARALGTHARMDIARAASIIDGVLDALTAAHKVGVVHRDIKPGNIMLVRDDDGEDVRVLDFGIAKVFDSEGDPTQLTASGRAIGTPSYMSPEQIKGREIGPATDIYSTGVLLFHLLAGRKPFRGESIFDVYRAHLEDRPPTREAGIPDPLGYVILRAMAKDPADRFPTATDMRGALWSALQAAEPTARSAAWVRDTVESAPPAAWVGVRDPADSSDTWRQPSSWWPRRLAVACIALLSFAALVWWGWTEQMRQPARARILPIAEPSARLDAVADARRRHRRSRRVRERLPGRRRRDRPRPGRPDRRGLRGRAGRAGRLASARGAR